MPRGDVEDLQALEAEAGAGWASLANIGQRNPLLDLYRSGHLGGPPEYGPGLDPIESGYLKFLSGLEGVGFGGPSLRIFNDVIGRGRRQPITERDFHERDLADLNELVLQEYTRTGKRKGNIAPRGEYAEGSYDFLDYPRPRTYLGGFKYEIDDEGNILVRDKYDFNKAKGGESERSSSFEVRYPAQELAAQAPEAGFAASIGRHVLPDTSGKGVPVKIRIPKGAVPGDESSDEFRRPPPGGLLNALKGGFAAPVPIPPSAPAAESKPFLRELEDRIEQAVNELGLSRKEVLKRFIKGDMQ